MATVRGFSRMSRSERIAWLSAVFVERDPRALARELDSFTHPDEAVQRVLESVSENSISNFHLPFGIVPNLIVNGRTYVVPMVTEESSVVAAASKGALFWSTRGGARAEVQGTRKVGQIHFLWRGDPADLRRFFAGQAEALRREADAVSTTMAERGGGLRELDLIDLSHLEPRLHQLRATFETCDAMGANFINSVLDTLAAALVARVDAAEDIDGEADVVMSILSNYTPGSVVRAWVTCPVAALGDFPRWSLDARGFAERFCTAVRIAEVDPYRATTHNKGIFNGIDAVAIATGNDFRALEACGHAYAARSGQYRSLSRAWIAGDDFHFELALPVAAGTVGGVTDLHPLGARALELMGSPSAREFMEILASVGLIQNFAAIMALVTHGTRGHMRLHLSNMLTRCQASPEETDRAIRHFTDAPFSLSSVQAYLAGLRNR